VKNTIAVFIFFLLTLHYSNAVPYAKQSHNKKLKKRAPIFSLCKMYFVYISMLPLITLLSI